MFEISRAPSFLLTWIDHVERDAISDVRKAVPEILYKDEGDGELYVRNEEGHRDGSCPPKFLQNNRIINLLFI